TGASGSLNKDVQVGNIGVLIDHISIPSFAGINPLSGPNLSMFGPRFLALSDAYDYDLRVKAFKAAEILNFPKDILKETVYCYLGGPTYETRAEAKLLSSLGADIVGMSTVPEIVVARHSGIRVLGLSLITNMVVIGNAKSANPATRNAYVTDEPPVNHEEVIAVGEKRASDMRNF
ncbi:13780_t:CDS:1, partial [Acaulospora colombiana]